MNDKFGNIFKTKTDWTLPHKCHPHHQTEEHHQHQKLQQQQQQQLLITPASNSLSNRPEVTQPHNLRLRVRVCLREVQMGTEVAPTGTGEVLVVRMVPTGMGPLTEEAVQAVLKSAPLCRCRSSLFEDWQTADVIRRNWPVGQIINILQISGWTNIGRTNVGRTYVGRTFDSRTKLSSPNVLV